MPVQFIHIKRAAIMDIYIVYILLLYIWGNFVAETTFLLPSCLFKPSLKLLTRIEVCFESHFLS